MNSLKQLDTEFNRLLTLFDRLLDRIEKEVAVTVRLDYFKRLCPPRISTFNRLLSIKSQIEQNEKDSGAQDNESPTENSGGNNFQSISAHASPTSIIDERHTHSETSGPKIGSHVPSNENNDETDIESLSASTPSRASPTDLCDESRNSVSNNTQGKTQSCYLDGTSFKIHRVSIPPRLREVSRRWLKDSMGVCCDIGPNPPKTAAGLASAFLQIYDQGEDAELLALYRRFQLRNFYLLAVDLDYHTGERWCRNASSDLAKQIREQRLSLEVGQEELKSHLDNFVGLGRKYNRWAAELGGPGYLLAMPLDITDREYTDRHYTKCIVPAIKKFREEGIDQIVNEYRFIHLGEFISSELWTQFRPLQDALRRPLTKSGKSNKKKRKRNEIGVSYEERETLNKARRLEYRGPSENLQLSTPELTSEATYESSLLCISHNLSKKGYSNLMSSSRDPDLTASINPEASADFPDMLDMTASTNPEASAYFPDMLDMTASTNPEASAYFPDVLDMMASINPMFGETRREREAVSKCLQSLLFSLAALQESEKERMEGPWQEANNASLALDTFLHESRQIWDESEDEIVSLIWDTFAKRREIMQIAHFVTTVTPFLQNIGTRLQSHQPFRLSFHGRLKG